MESEGPTSQSTPGEDFEWISQKAEAESDTVCEKYKKSLISMNTALNSIECLLFCFEWFHKHTPIEMPKIPVSVGTPRLHMSGPALYAQYLPANGTGDVFYAPSEALKNGEAKKCLARFARYLVSIGISLNRSVNGFSFVIGGRDEAGEPIELRFNNVCTTGRTHHSIKAVTEYLREILRGLSAHVLADRTGTDITLLVKESDVGDGSVSAEIYKKLVMCVFNEYYHPFKLPRLMASVHKPLQTFPFPVRISIDAADFRLALLLRAYMEQKPFIKIGFRCLLISAERTGLVTYCHPDMLAIMWVAFLMSHCKDIQYIDPESIKVDVAKASLPILPVDKSYLGGVCIGKYIADFCRFVQSGDIDGKRINMQWDSDMRRFARRCTLAEKANLKVLVYHPFKPYEFLQNTTEASYAEMKQRFRVES